MKSFVPRAAKGPEAIIQEKIVARLRLLTWFVKETHGNLYQSGLPDLYASHRVYGPRWIEVKNPLKYCWTAAQKIDFPQFMTNGSPIWVLTSDEDSEINKLFKPSNLWFYMK